MNKLKRLLKYVTKEEDKYYDFSHKAREEGNDVAFQIHMGEATAFQRVRYAIESLINNE